MAGVPPSHHTLAVLYYTRVLQQSYMAHIIPAGQQPHSLLVRAMRSINCINISSIHERLPNPLYRPAQGDIPCGPLLIPCHSSTTCDLFARLCIPKQQLISSTCRMQIVSIPREIKMFNIAIVFDRLRHELKILLL